MMKEALLLYNGWHRGTMMKETIGSQSVEGKACGVCHVRRWRNEKWRPKKRARNGEEGQIVIGQ